VTEPAAGGPARTGTSLPTSSKDLTLWLFGEAPPGAPADSADLDTLGATRDAHGAIWFQYNSGGSAINKPTQVLIILTGLLSSLTSYLDVVRG
jgi:hypothetical protein